MSIPSIPRDGRSPSRPVPDGAPRNFEELAVFARHRLPKIVRTGARCVTRPARAIAFWSAIALPFLHLGLLANGLETTAQTTTFVVLLVVNLFALLLGHSYGQGN